MTATYPTLESTGFVDYSFVEKIFMSEQLKISRAFEVRAIKAKHLHGELNGAQLHFVAVRYRNKLLLVDGSARCEAIADDLTKRPKMVSLSVYRARSFAQVEALYDQINNSRSVKSARDRVEGGLRACGMRGRLMSQLMTQSALPSALKYATGLASERDAAVKLIKGIVRLDNLGLERGHISAGVLSGFLVIAELIADQKVFEAFVRRVHQPTFMMQEKEDMLVVATRQLNESRLRSGTFKGAKNIIEMRDNTLGYFQAFYDAARGERKIVIKCATLSSFKAWAAQLAA